MEEGDSGDKAIDLDRLRLTDDDESGDDVSSWCWVDEVGDIGEMGDVGWDCIIEEGWWETLFKGEDGSEGDDDRANEVFVSCVLELD